MSPYYPSHYPPTLLTTKKEHLTVLQITDLHLSKKLNNQIDNSTQSFQLILNQALSEKQACDLILVTGDLVNQIDTKLYDDIFATLTNTNIAFACIAGNHDVTEVIATEGEELAFEDKTFIAKQADPRLLNQHVIESTDWQIILLDSSDAGKVSGWLNDEDLTWLHEQLTDNSKNALICLHHHVLPVNSAWMDTHILQNAGRFWQLISPFSQVKSILHGHIHQQTHQPHQGVQVFGTPSTCYQFKPHQVDFTLDSEPAGYRWLYLYNNGSIETNVKRLNVP